MGFPESSVGKESAWNAGDLGFIPGLGRSPGEGKGYPLQYSGLGNFKECIVHGVAKSRTRLNHFHFHSSVKLLFKIPPFGFIAFLCYLLAFCFTDLCLHCTIFCPCTWSLLTCMLAKLLQLCLTVCNPRDCTRQVPLSMAFPRQEYWSGLPCPPPGHLPNPGIQPESLRSPALAGGFFPTRATWGAPHGLSLVS